MPTTRWQTSTDRGAALLWDYIEAAALVAVVAGGFLMFGPVALIVGGLLVLALSWFVNRERKGAAA